MTAQNLYDLGRELAEHLPPNILRIKVAALNPKTRDDFTWAVREALRIEIHELEKTAQHFQSVAEEAITSAITRGLRANCFDATNEEAGRGHADLTIKCNSLKTEYILEAKVHTGYEHLTNGLEQLLTRYMTGTEPEGGMLIYIRDQKKSALVIRR